MAPKNKIENHPQRETIINWLLQGVSVRDVEHRLNQLYPGPIQHHLRVSFSTIQSFRKNFLNLEDEVLGDIKEATQLSRDQIKNDVVKAEVEQTSAYKEKINQIVDTQLDAQREILKTFNIIENRIEALYNKIQRNDGVEGFTDTKIEMLFIKYLDQFMKAIDSYKKYVDNYREGTDINVSVSIMTDQVSIIREAVREVLADMDPSVAVVFMEKLNSRMKALKDPAAETDYNGVMVDNPHRARPTEHTQ